MDNKCKKEFSLNLLFLNKLHFWHQNHVTLVDVGRLTVYNNTSMENTNILPKANGPHLSIL